MMGGIVLHEGDIAEMRTGEGKTFVATMPLYLNSLTGENVHLVTVNDYLAKRDPEWVKPVYDALGVRSGYIQNMMPFSQRKEAYAGDITYGTNAEFGFDYLRDNMAVSLDGTVQRGHPYAIVDEVDSILIDEARTPLIISGEPEAAAKVYYDFARVVKQMEGFGSEGQGQGPRRDGDVGCRLHVRQEVQDGLAEPERHRQDRARAQHRAALRPEERPARQPPDPGAEGAGALPSRRRLRDPGRRGEDRRRVHGPDHGRPALVGGLAPGGGGQGGRGHPGRERDHGDDHAPELLPPVREARGHDRYGQDRGEGVRRDLQPHVAEIPTNVDVARADENDYIFKTKEAKYDAVLEDIKERHEEGQPVLVGTISVEVSEHLSQRLLRAGIPHNVLNAKEHEREAEIIKDAGQPGAVTIATNMAGRGVDIKLGEGVDELGGLYVLGTERHEARRIDNQLRGRSGRQGDPGESRFYLSGQDDLVRLFAGDRIHKIMERFKVPDDQPMESGILSHQIENAQKKVEEQNFVSRKNVLKYDDVLNMQREVIYEQRRQVLEGEDLSEEMQAWIDEVIERDRPPHRGRGRRGLGPRRSRPGIRRPLRRGITATSCARTARCRREALTGVPRGRARATSEKEEQLRM